MANLKRVGATAVWLAGCADTQPVKEVTQSGFWAITPCFTQAPKQRRSRFI